MSRLLQLAFHSRSIDDATTGEQLGFLRAIMNSARTANAAQNITGCLIFDARCYIEVLEGDADAVNALFEKISRDRRHHSVKSLGTRWTMSRAFAGWSMKAVMINLEAQEVLLRHGMTLPIETGRLTLDSTIDLCRDLAATFNSGHLAA